MRRKKSINKFSTLYQNNKTKKNNDVSRRKSISAVKALVFSNMVKAFFRQNSDWGD